MKLIATSSVHINDLLRAPDPRDRKDKGEYKRRVVEPGQAFEVDDEEAVSLIRGGYAARDPSTGVGAAGQAAGEATAPKLKADRLGAIGEAIKGLDSKNEEHFTTSGKPSTAALQQALGWGVSAAERDEAWTLVNKPAK